MLKMRGNTILTDRWPGTNRHLRNNNFWLHVNNAIYSFFPHPDLYIFLSASPILIHKRKPELSINEITRLQKNLRKKIARHNHIEIETENIDKSLTKTLKTIFDEQKKPIISC
jgi:hypothetical protein